MRVFVWTVLLAAFLAGCSTDYGTYAKMARGPEADGYSYAGNVTRWSGPDAVLEAAYLSPAATELYFSHLMGGRYESPFPPKSFTVFSLLVENKGKAAFTFDPRMTWLYPEDGEPMTVKDYSAVYVELEMAEAERLEERMKAFKETCFDSAVTLAPGERVQRLLVFPSYKGSDGKAALVVEGLYTGRTPRSIPLLMSGVSAR